MEQLHSPRPWAKLQDLIRTGRSAEIESFLGRLSAPEIVRSLSRLSEDERTRLFSLLAPSEAAQLFEQMPDVQAVEVIEEMEPSAAAAILLELPSNEQADLLGDLELSDAEAILAAMSPEQARDARSLTRYADDVAGGLMVTEYLAYSDRLTVGEVSRDIQDNADRYRDYQVQYVFVTDRKSRLAGVLRLRDLLLAPKDRPVRELMIREPQTVLDTDALDDLRAFFERYSFFGAPVVDGSGRLVGIVKRASVQKALAERTGSDYLKSQGIVGGEELRSMALWVRSRRRLSWLSINIVLNVIAASVIAAYQETLAAVIALAVFLPIISDMSGCSGNQAVAVSMRELTLGFVRPSDLLRVWLKEISVGLLNGLALGALIGFVAWLWKGNVILGVVVGTAMAVNTMIAVSIGGIVPLLMRRMKMDPALASGPILTTITDLCGFFLLLSIASAVLHRLAG